jgi:hypothetical protein
VQPVSRENLQISDCDIRILIVCVELTHREEVSRNLVVEIPSGRKLELQGRIQVPFLNICSLHVLSLVRVEGRVMPSAKSHGIASLEKSICRGRFERMGRSLRLIPGYKANHWFIFIRKERSSCSQQNLLKKMRA